MNDTAIHPVPIHCLTPDLFEERDLKTAGWYATAHGITCFSDEDRIAFLSPSLLLRASRLTDAVPVDIPKGSFREALYHLRMDGRDKRDSDMAREIGCCIHEGGGLDAMLLVWVSMTFLRGGRYATWLSKRWADIPGWIEK